MVKSKVWICDLCGFRTPSYNGFVYHMEYSHGVILFKDESKPVKTTYAGYDEEENREFEKSSFNNMVNFYRDELLRIYKGNDIGDLSKTDLSRLKKMGLIESYYIPKGHESDSIIKITDDAKTILGIE